MKGAPHCSLLVAAVITVATACDRVDLKKFDGVYRAGKALEVDIDNIGGVPVSESQKLLKQLQTEIATLQGRTSGQRESDALGAYFDAADAYKEFLRFRFLDLNGGTNPDGWMLIRGGNIDAVAKYRLPVETRGDSKWIETGVALRLLSDAAKKKITEAARLVNGQS